MAKFTITYQTDAQTSSVTAAVPDGLGAAAIKQYLGVVVDQMAAGIYNAQAAQTRLEEASNVETVAPVGVQARTDLA